MFLLSQVVCTFSSFIFCPCVFLSEDFCQQTFYLICIHERPSLSRTIFQSHKRLLFSNCSICVSPRSAEEGWGEKVSSKVHPFKLYQKLLLNRKTWYRVCCNIWNELSVAQYTSTSVWPKYHDYCTSVRSKTT